MLSSLDDITLHCNDNFVIQSIDITLYLSSSSNLFSYARQIRSVSKGTSRICCFEIQGSVQDILLEFDASLPSTARSFIVFGGRAADSYPIGILALRVLRRG